MSSINGKWKTKSAHYNEIKTFVHALSSTILHIKSHIDIVFDALTNIH